ncbi:MAG TPA: tetratricopeptide repeat protein [Candidatus Polarisedimenticolaceae bacterium]|nr:tetratricopeptide repeat protein [Candidatus Polarisedimenticolaceae bacterium]
MSRAWLLAGLALAACSRTAGPPTVRERAPVASLVVAGDPGLCGAATEDAQEGARALRAAADAGNLAAVSVDYPLPGSIFPPEIAAPTFLWHDGAAEADRWLVEVGFGEGQAPLQALVGGEPAPPGAIDPRCVAVTNEVYRPTPAQASARSWKPCPDLWEEMKARSAGRPSTVTLLGFRDGTRTPVSRGSIPFTTSTDPLRAPIFYRDVPLMPSATEEGVIKPLDQSAQPLIAWRLKDVSRDDSRVLLTGMPSCANCHSFSADGKTLGMDLDGPTGDKGAYVLASLRPRMVIEDPDVVTWNAFPGKTPGLNTLGFLARVSPDGRHVIATVNEALYVRNFTDYRFSQVFYPTRGILAVLSRETGRIEALPGADDPAYVHCDPTWSPDGQTIVFSRAPARDPYDRARPLATYADDPNETPIRYDLYRIPFRDGKGGTAEPIAGASANGKSNSFPKITPDGRFIVWVQARNGQLMRPDGQLWIVPFGGGTPRRMVCNTARMNSWHSFDPSGRWMVFSSKQNTPYTQMFLSHLDEEGNDSPPILIENATAANRAVNIPEFLNAAYDGLQSIEAPVTAYHAFFKKGNELARAGRYREALTEYERALGPSKKSWRINDWRIHDSLSKVYFKLGEMDEALQHAHASLEMNPANAEMQGSVGLLLFQGGDLAGARRHLDLALRLAPEDARTWFNRASVRLNQGDGAGAAKDFTRALALDPAYGDASAGRGVARLGLGDLSGAQRDLDRALALNPRDTSALTFRAQVRVRRGDRAGARRDLTDALALVPQGSSEEASLRQLLQQMP